MASFADITIRFGADLKQFSSAMQNARRDINKTGKSLQKAGAGLTLAVTAPLTALAGISLSNFDKQAKALAQVQQGLISTGNAVGFTTQELEKQAAALQANSLFGDEVILKDATAQLLTFTNISGEAFQRTQQAALDLATRLDGDLKSASIQLGKALNDPIANLSALSRSGIQFSAEQKGLINTLVSTGRAAEAQSVILDELEKQYGGSAKAAAQAGLGPFTQFKNILSDITEDFGAIIMDGLNPFVAYLKEAALKFKELSPATKKWIVIFGGIAAAIGPLLALAGTILPAIATGLTLLTGPIGLVVAALVAIGSVIYKYWDPIKGVLIDIANYFVDLYNSSTVFRVGIEAIKTSFQNIFEVGSFVFTQLQKIMVAVASITIQQFKNVGKIIKAVLTGDFETVGEVLSISFDKNIEGFKNLVTSAKSDFESLKSSISDNITGGVENALMGKKYELFSKNVDTTALQEKVSEAVTKGIEAGTTGTNIDPTPLIQRLEIDPQGVADFGASPLDKLTADDGPIKKATLYIDEFQARLIDFNAESADVLSDIAGNFISGFADIVGGIAAGTASFGDVGAFLLNTIANIAQQLGKAVISIGVTMNSLKLAFSNPFAAIAAGGALVAFGALLKGLAKRYAGNFSDGGIVPGSSFTGDRLTAGVNSGELILNVSQQKNLANALTSGSRIALMPSLEYNGRDFRVLLNEVDEFNNRVS